jgi:bifunctional non-homologous end joining protein LigD
LVSPKSPHVGEKLAKYREKRSAGRTPEPFGQSETQETQRFVVQKHAATRLHYDFRLEMGGVLVSWAVPKGPSRDPREKRMAVHVEDHPVEYVDFEGVIPEKNYGAGPVIVWDKGRWSALEDPVEGMKKGKLLFELFGYKLRGVWTLVRTKRNPKDWLLIKHKDPWAADHDDWDESSVLSGLTLEEMKQGPERAAEIREVLEGAGVPHKTLRASDAELMLAEPRDDAFTDEDWLFEIKLDGYRILAEKHDDAPHLYYRRGSDATALYPELSVALARLPSRDLVLDGEVVVNDAAGRPSFQRLQKRALLTRKPDVMRAAVELPAILWVFDLLAYDGFDLRKLPLVERKALLKRLLPRTGPIRYVDHIETRGKEMMEAARGMGLEGIVAKKKSSTYRGGRSSDWLKLRFVHTGDFAVVGFTEPQGTRVAIGSVHVAWWDGDTFRYAGSVGSGFNDKQLGEARKEMEKHRRDDAPFVGEPLPGRANVWCEPTMVVEVRYKDWTDDRLLRQPVFLRFRDDKTPTDCTDRPKSRESEPPPPADVSAVDKTLTFSNLDKIFWPKEGLKKGDLIEYYRAMAPWLMHYLRDRPVVLTRFPDGIEGKSFFQKDAPEWTPEWVRTEVMWSDDTQREIHHFVADDVETLLYIANLGAIPLHIWASRVATLEHPDWCILDLDPKGAPFADVISVALAARELCEEIELPSFVKTSGSTGLHVMVPLGRLCTFEQAKQLGQLLATVIVERVSDIATIARAVGARGGKVYVDFLQNGHGKLIAAPFSARPVPGATCSATLDWSEVGPKLDPSRFTLTTLPRRMEKLGTDPMAPILATVPDLPEVLQNLGDRIPSRKR